MGSYAECWLGHLLVASTKNDVDPGLMRLFRRSDKMILALTSVGVPAQLKRRFAWRNEDVDLEDVSAEPEVVYDVAPVSVVKDRLNVLGYTVETARQAFDEGLSGRQAQLDAWRRAREEEGSSEAEELLLSSYVSEQKVLSGLSCDRWLATLREILGGEAGNRDNDSTSPVHSTEITGDEWYKGPLKGTLTGYMLSREWFAFPSPDTTAALRLTLEVCPNADRLVYDITDLIWSGYASRDDDFVGYSSDVSIEEMQSLSKVILLTEGSSDARILRSSLELLYPHLADYYSFMEFDAMRVSGGSGNLANLVKAFAGAGVVNKTIALFDNDTGGQAALRGIANLDLPQHLAVLTLPPLESLKTYPTIGPSGPADMDINGLAASIELYLGEDVLADGEGQCRIQWTGYDSALKQYQGEVLHKAEIQSRFQEKLKKATRMGTSVDGPEWSGLRAIFDRVFAAFHGLDKARILEFTQEYYAGE